MPEPIIIPQSLEIGGQTYRLEVLAPDPAVAKRAWRLSYTRFVKKTHEWEQVAYDIAETQFGLTCECPDLVYRHKEEKGETCKHVFALIEAELI